MSKRNLIIGGGVIFLVLVAAWWFGIGPLNVALAKGEAKKLIIASLPERASVEFRNLKGYYTDRICGEINVTNGQGGYRGFEPFIWERIGGVELKPEIETGSDLESVQKLEQEFWERKYSDCMANGI